ncbi:hypothetical protein [Actinoplanes sp. NPDC020271]|uniref:hypothetical protein n=1 Tax=Actinoplanes sp. NPDC020271 TaxID=3363896 RepID=UPI0037B682E0
MRDVRWSFARSSGGPARRRLVEGASILLVVAMAALLFTVRYYGPEKRTSGDSFWYMRQALIFTGVDAETARKRAEALILEDYNRAGGDRTTYDTSTAKPRYRAIFDSRPGYPLFAAPFVAVLGPWTGMIAATLVLALVAAVLAYLAVWLASGLRLAGILASVLLFVLPTGFWMSRMLAEAGVVAGMLAVLLGAMLVRRGRLAGGIPLIVAALTWLFAVRSASGMAMSLVLLATGALTLAHRASRRRAKPLVDPASPRQAKPLVDPASPRQAKPLVDPASPRQAKPLVGPASRRAEPLVDHVSRPGAGLVHGGSRRGPALIMGLGGLGVAGWALVSQVLGLPGFDETVQDYATVHFRAPDVADPIHWLIGKNLAFWPSRLSADLTALVKPVVLLAVLSVFVLRMRPVAALWILTGLTGVAMVVAHPVPSQYERLMMPLWIPLAAVLGYAGALALRRPLRRGGPDHAEVDAVEGGDHRQQPEDHHGDRAAGPGQA